MSTRVISLALFALVSLCACAPLPEDAESAEEEVRSELAPNGRNTGIFNGTARARGDHGTPVGEAPVGAFTGNGISYHNGPVMLGEVRLYYIWYGAWSGNTATTILTDFGNALGGSPYWNINTTYRNRSGTFLSNSLRLAGSTTDSYSRGTALTDSNIRAIVSDAITSRRLPSDANGIYLVLTSQDVTATSGFCTSYCGWHTHASIGGVDIKYGFVGNSARCITACAAQSAGPNDNAGADGMASIIAHEAEEVATDPDLNAWYDSRGYENADKCAWTFGATSTATNGSLFNVTLGARRYLIQQNWVDGPRTGANGYCSMSYP